MNSETRNKIVQMDLSLVAPICYLTETFNALLRGCFRTVRRYPWACLSLTLSFSCSPKYQRSVSRHREL